MKLEIISSQMTGIFQALTNRGLVMAGEVKWIRQPARVNGMWRASVWV
jgi:hypothetical protein